MRLGTLKQLHYSGRMQESKSLPSPIHRFIRRTATPAVWLLLAAALPANAVICKTVSDDGVVSYTDTPMNECSSPVKLPAYSRYAPRPLSSSAKPSAGAGGKAAAGGEPFTGYTDMQIETPAHNGTVRSNEGKVPVKVTLEPPLQKGHKVQFFLDGKPTGPGMASTGATLTGVNRGTHTLSVQVQDERDRVLYSAGPIRFTLRKEALESGAGNAGTGGAYTPAYDPASAKEQAESFDSKKAADGTFDESGKFNKSFEKSNKGNYSSTPGSIPKSSGTNPAFAPKYKP